MQGEYCSKNEKKRDSRAMLGELYEKILSNFIERVYKENRFRPNGLDAHALYFLEKVGVVSHRELGSCWMTPRNCFS